MIVYIDVLIIVNFLVGYFLLITSAVMSGYTYNRKRIIVASFLGAFFCLFIFADIESCLASCLIKILSMLFITISAFGFSNKKKLIIQTFYYFLLNALLTGLVFAVSFKNSGIYHNNMFFYLNINPVILVLSSLIIYLFLLLAEIVKEKVSPRKNYIMDIFFKDFCLKQIPVFYDSGFNIKDIVSNKDVIILNIEKVRDNIPEATAKNITDFINEKYDEVSCLFVPVMFTTLSGSGMLPAIKAEYIYIENKRIKNIVVAFTNSNLGENTYAIFGSDIKRQL